MATPEEMEASMVANLKEKTGRTLDAWLVIAKKAGLAKHGELVKHLKTEHGMTHGYASLVSRRHLSAGQAAPAADDFVDAQYAGPKAAMRPVLDAVLKAVSRFGRELEISPKKTYVSLRRKKQFALVQPSTKTRVDLGLNLGDVPAKGRLEASGSFNAMVSHRVRLESPADVDAEVRAWLHQAFDRA
ncbi:MAG: DUF5655 domain-containing protein [Planctomycetota bacterium]